MYHIWHVISGSRSTEGHARSDLHKNSNISTHNGLRSLICIDNRYKDGYDRSKCILLSCLTELWLQRSSTDWTCPVEMWYCLEMGCSSLYLLQMSHYLLPISILNSTSPANVQSEYYIYYSCSVKASPLLPHNISCPGPLRVPPFLPM